MSKPLTRTQINEKKFRRINDKSLRQLLIHRFLNDYGYDKGEVTATAIVDDILKTVEDYFVITLPLEKLATGDALPEERLSFLKEDARDPNATYSLMIAGKPININLPAILWSFDTISR